MIRSVARLGRAGIALVRRSMRSIIDHGLQDCLASHAFDRLHKGAPDMGMEQNFLVQP
jgi:hypothetical protein